MPTEPNFVTNVTDASESLAEDRHYHVECQDSAYPHDAIDIAFATFNLAADFERSLVNKQHERAFARRTKAHEERFDQGLTIVFDDDDDVGGPHVVSLEISHCFGKHCVIRDKSLPIMIADSWKENT